MEDRDDTTEAGLGAHPDSLSDRMLLRQYVAQGSEAAFSRLVRRHLNLVYAACRREVGDPDAAEEITLAVFLLLARKAPGLRAEAGLAGWLFQTARFAAKNARRREARRQRREQKAAETMGGTQAAQDSGEDFWSLVEPHLNDALAALGAADREAVLLRFFEGQSLAEVGAWLGLSENTARMRVARAVEKIRRSLTRAGVPLTAVALTALLAAQAARSAPASCLAAVLHFTPAPGVLLPPPGPAGTHLYQFTQGVWKAMWIKTVTISTLIATAFVGAVTVHLIGASAHRAQTAGAAYRPSAARVMAAAATAVPVPVTQASTIDIGSPALDIQFGKDDQTLQIASFSKWRKEPYPFADNGSGGRLMQMEIPTRTVQTHIANMGEVAVGSVALSPDGNTAAALVLEPSGLSYHVQLWDVVTAQPEFALPIIDYSDWQQTGLLGLNFSADGTRLLTLQRGGDAEVWDVPQKKRLSQTNLMGGHVFENALLSPDAGHIAYVGEDSVLRVYDLKSGETREMADNESCHRLAFSPDGTLLAVATNQGIDLWSMSTGKKARTLSGQVGFAFSLAFSRDGSQLACGTIQTGTTRPDWRGSVFLWKVATGQPLKTISGFTESVMSLALSPDGTLLVTGSNFESVVRIWKLNS